MASGRPSASVDPTPTASVLGQGRSDDVTEVLHSAIGALSEATRSSYLPQRGLSTPTRRSAATAGASGRRQEWDSVAPSSGERCMTSTRTTDRLRTRRLVASRRGLSRHPCQRAWRPGRCCPVCHRPDMGCDATSRGVITIEPLHAIKRPLRFVVDGQHVSPDDGVRTTLNPNLSVFRGSPYRRAPL